MHRRPATGARALVSAGLLLSILTGCSDSGGGGPAAPSSPLSGPRCEGYSPWSTSPFVLPYAVGTSHQVTQGNCTIYTHKGLMRYAYDFEMAIGTPVTASRAGTVAYLEEHWPNGDGVFRHSNIVRVEHSDGTFALYAHLTTDGVLVEIGDSVLKGDVIAISGNSGYTLNLPHLHFHVAPCSFYENCGTVPTTFSNTRANESGLVEGVAYEAEPFM